MIEVGSVGVVKVQATAEDEVGVVVLTVGEQSYRIHVVAGDREAASTLDHTSRIIPLIKDSLDWVKYIANVELERDYLLVRMILKAISKADDLRLEQVSQGSQRIPVTVNGLSAMIGVYDAGHLLEELLSVNPNVDEQWAQRLKIAVQRAAQAYARGIWGRRLASSEADRLIQEVVHEYARPRWITVDRGPDGVITIVGGVE